MKKIMTVFGTRPEAIKLAPVIKEIGKHPEIFESVVCVTGQHRQMLDQVLTNFEVIPDYDLNVMMPSQDMFGVVINTLEKIKDVLVRESPDIVLVQGDTITTFVAALASFYFRIQVGHVEAGLRTFKKASPFPEEINRKLTSVMTDYHFSPTELAKNNLLKEGFPLKSIFVTGNTVIDALLMTVRKEYDFDRIGLSEVEDWPRLVLITGHRRESFGQPFEEICEAIRQLAVLHPDILMIYPVHLNPNVRDPVYRILGGLENIRLIEPLEYEPFVQLMNKAYFIITDSGGVQEEAPSLGKPVLVTREVTERQEAVLAGTVRLVGHNRKRIIEEGNRLLWDEKFYKEMARAVNPYGDGRASQRIVEILSTCSV